MALLAVWSGRAFSTESLETRPEAGHRVLRFRPSKKIQDSLLVLLQGRVGTKRISIVSRNPLRLLHSGMSPAPPETMQTTAHEERLHAGRHSRPELTRDSRTLSRGGKIPHSKPTMAKNTCQSHDATAELVHRLREPALCLRRRGLGARLCLDERDRGCIAWRR